MYENKKSYDLDDVLALILKILLVFAAIAAAVVAGLKIYEKIQSKKLCSLCDCCDDEYYDEDDNFFFDEDEDDDCECKVETVAEVTEHEINPTEN